VQDDVSGSHKNSIKEYKLSNFALSAYPLSQAFQTKLEGLAGEPIQFFLLSELRQQKPFGFLKFLRGLKANQFFLVLEDQNSQILLPILQLIAKISSPKKMIVVNSDMGFQVVKMKDIIIATLKLIKATCCVHLSYRLADRKMIKLLNHPVINRTKSLNDSKKALYLNANLWFGVKAGGSVGHIAGVINALVKKGIKVDYAAVDKSNLLDPAVSYDQLPLLDSFGVPAELNYYYFNDKVINYLSNKKSSNWDFIYQRMSLANFSGVALSQHFNIPLVIEYNGSEAWIAKNWGRTLRYHDAAIKAEEVCLTRADLIVTISEVLKQELIDRGVAPEKIVCYPNCVDPELFNPKLFSEEDNRQLRAKHGISSESLVFTFVGTFGQWHGVDILAKVIRFLAEEQESWLLENQVHFMLVGDGIKMSQVKSILGDYLNKPYITFTGLVPQASAPSYLAASDVLLSPHVANNDGSRFFGSPTKLFEYMAMGKPIIASDLEQLGEVLKHSLRVGQLPTEEPNSTRSELSILCEPGNVDQIVISIQFLVANKAWRDCLGANARQETLAKYTWERHVEAFLDAGQQSS
jgi:glycosyltransferase involved in cell wall biosynthesis